MPHELVSHHISASDLSLLDVLEGAGPGSVGLQVTDLDRPGYERVADFLTDHGGLVRVLTLHPHRGFFDHGDLRDVDFAARCPNLESLDVRRVLFDGSVFVHPVLRDLRLKQSKYTGGPRISVGAAQPLEVLEVEDCHIEADVLAIGPESRLEVFRYSLDEDYAEACPDRFELLGTRLEEIYVNACWAYRVTTSTASERLNRRRTFLAGQYGSVTHVRDDGDGERLVLRQGPQDD
ncbi:hypothetical protein [Streptomyces sp. NPDC007264]|uniref:hypothetical protein n=1 Tax=Streptomyces sp. NPDC007264 TaxID=3364777 RepID=UPI0036D83EFD